MLCFQSVIFSHPIAIKCLTAGRVIMVKRPMGQAVLGVVLESKLATNNEREYKTLIISDKDSPNETKKITDSEFIFLLIVFG